MSRAIAERRAHARFVKTFELEGSSPDGAVARMVASDLSLGGLHCSSAADYPVMTRLLVRLLLPDGGASDSRPLDVEAVVVRRKKLPSASGGQRFELALFFTSLRDEARERLARFIARSDA